MANNDAQLSLGIAAPFGENAADAPTEIGLFIPAAEDSSNRVANILAERLRDETDINMVLFLTKQPDDPRVDASPWLKKKRFVHGTLLGDVVFPFQRVNADIVPQGTLLAPDLLAKRSAGRVRVVEVENPNDPCFIEKHITGNPALKMAFSVRNLTIFRQEIIDAFAAKGKSTFLNLHPGKLPAIRGLEGPFWSRYLDRKNYYTTMIEIDPRIDAGRIMDVETKLVNGSAPKAVATYTRDAAPLVAHMIYKQADMILSGDRREGIVQNEAESGYYTLPTAAQIEDAFRKKGIKIVAGAEQIQYLLGQYGGDKHSEYNAKLMEHLWHQYELFQRGQYETPDPKTLSVNEDYLEHESGQLDQRRVTL